jgi:hypothetical protein
MGSRLPHLHTLNNVTVNGVSGLTPSDIPDLSGSYLPLAGGTVTGNLTINGAFNGGSLTLSNASTTLFSAYGPAYFGGTATSSFNSSGQLSLVSNGLTVGANQLVVSGGNIGIGTTTPAANFVVNGTTGQNLFRIAASTNQNIFTIDQNGFTGIGIVPGSAGAADVLEIASANPIAADTWGCPGRCRTMPAPFGPA